MENCSGACDFDLIGSIAWFSSENIPDGFLVCNGQAVGRGMYRGLFKVIGSTFGDGDGEYTFNLPDLMDRTGLNGMLPCIRAVRGVCKCRC